MKKVLVLSVTTGEGHNAMGKALIDYYGSNADIECKMIDLFKPDHKFYAWFINEFYFWTVKMFPHIVRSRYLPMVNRNAKNNSKTYIHRQIKPVLNKVINTINDFQPDVIFCTHTFSATVINQLKKGYNFYAKTFFIFSDYAIHPYTENANVLDYLITPHEDLHNKALEKGFTESQLLSFGIPVNKKFSENKDKTQARIELNIEPDKLTVMVMNGGQGAVNSAVIVESIEKAVLDLQIIVVNGKSEKAKASVDKLIESKGYKNIINLGFARNVDTIMAASDILIGKCGGVALTEAFNRNLPVLISPNPPFTEYYNMLYLTKIGAAIYAKTNKQIPVLLRDIVEDPTKMNKMREQVQRIRKPNAVIDLAAFMLTLPDIERTMVLKTVPKSSN